MSDSLFKRKKQLHKFEFLTKKDFQSTNLKVSNFKRTKQLRLPERRQGLWSVPRQRNLIPKAHRNSETHELELQRGDETEAIAQGMKLRNNFHFLRHFLGNQTGKQNQFGLMLMRIYLSNRSSKSVLH